jgi:hypothetical protein
VLPHVVCIALPACIACVRALARQVASNVLGMDTRLGRLRTRLVWTRHGVMGPGSWLALSMSAHNYACCDRAGCVCTMACWWDKQLSPMLSLYTATRSLGSTTPCRSTWGWLYLNQFAQQPQVVGLPRHGGNSPCAHWHFSLSALARAVTAEHSW